jgi:hypothetical protein
MQDLEISSWNLGSALVHKDYFIETSEKLSAMKSGAIRDKLSDLNLGMTCTPSIEVAEGLHLTYSRIGDHGINNMDFDKRVKVAIDRFNGTLVAQSFEELWDTYERSANYFVVDVNLENGSRKRIPLAYLEPAQEPVGKIARAPGLILGGPDFQKQLNSKYDRSVLEERVRELSENIRISNELSDEERKDILGYLGAIDKILGQTNPDKIALRLLLDQMGKRITSYSMKLGERYVTTEILEFIKDLFSSGLQF